MAKKDFYKSLLLFAPALIRICLISSDVVISKGVESYLSLMFNLLDDIYEELEKVEPKIGDYFKLDDE